MKTRFLVPGVAVLVVVGLAAPAFAQTNALYVPNKGSHTVSVIDTATDTVGPILPITCPARDPRCAAAAFGQFPLGLEVAPTTVGGRRKLLGQRRLRRGVRPGRFRVLGSRRPLRL